MGAAAIAVFLILVPLVAVTVDRIGGHDLARIAQVALGLFCAFAALRPRKTEVAELPPMRVGVLILLACFSLAAVLQAAVPAMAARELALTLGILAVVSVVANAPDADRLWALVTSAAGTLYVAVLGLILFTGLMYGGAINRPDLFLGYDNHRFFNHVQTAALPMALAALAVPGVPRLGRILARFALVGGCMLLFVSAGRGTFVALVLAMLFAGVVFGRRAFPTLRALGLALLAGLALFVLLVLIVPWWMHGPPPPLADYAPGRLGSSQSRDYLWRIACQQVLEAPWFGIGPMHFAYAPNEKAAHPHNLYLQLAAEWGLPFAVLACGCIAWMFGRLVRTLKACRRPDDLGTGIPLLIGCAAVAVDAAVSGNLVMPVSQVWIAVLVGWTLAWWRANAATMPERRRGAAELSVPTPIIGLALILSQLWLVAQVLPEAADMDAHLAEAMRAFPSERTQPRFWSHGRF